MSEDVMTEGWWQWRRDTGFYCGSPGRSVFVWSGRSEEAVTFGEVCEGRKSEGTGVKGLGFWKRSCFLMRRQMGSSNLGRRIYQGVEFQALKPGREAKQTPEYLSWNSGWTPENCHRVDDLSWAVKAHALALVHIYLSSVVSENPNPYSY